MIGAKLGNYRILEKIGAGGQGTVYKATDTKLGRAVVIKVLPPELTVKEANLKRFEREARLTSALDHPNICTVHEIGEAGIKRRRSRLRGRSRLRFDGRRTEHAGSHEDKDKDEHVFEHRRSPCKWRGETTPRSLSCAKLVTILRGRAT